MTDDKKILKEQLRHIAERITEEGRRMDEEPLVTEYDNGGGQCGIRENPYYPAYEKLLASYVKTLTALKALSGSGDAEVRSLDEIRNRFKVAK